MLLTEVKHTLIIPAFNEEEKIEKNINKVVSFLRNNLDEFEVIITENGSTDNTFIIALQVAEKNPCVKVIHIKESGRGRALREAFKQASSPDIVGYIDADLPFDLQDYLNALKKLVENKADLVIGSRNMVGAYVKRPLIRSFLSKIFNFSIKILLGLNVNDSQCGLKILRKEKFLLITDKIRNNNWFFDTELIFWFHLSGYLIKEVPVHCNMTSSTKVKIILDSWYMVNSILRLLIYRLKLYYVLRRQ
jgi:glycosyltransferase involved in cell wall biosynthesis